MSPHSIIYQSLTQSWHDPLNLVQINAEDGLVIVKIPLRFLAASGSHTWDYVLFLVGRCVEGHGHIVSEGGVPVDGLPLAGVYTFVCDTGTIALRPGPQGKSRIRPPSAVDSVSTVSNSKRSSTNQNKFRVDLMVRDYNCLVTGTHREECTASHIVPYSRTDVYLTFGIEYQFHVSAGLLLDDRYHHSYDNYKWSLYDPGDGNLIVHYFKPTSPEHRALHGKIIPRSRFRIDDISELPDPLVC